MRSYGQLWYEWSSNVADSIIHIHFHLVSRDHKIADLGIGGSERQAALWGAEPNLGIYSGCNYGLTIVWRKRRRFLQKFPLTFISVAGQIDDYCRLAMDIH